jgi:hypothetical protein
MSGRLKATGKVSVATRFRVLDENLARLRTHRNNINRYRRLLQTHLTECQER